jgi:hypothetical protein
MKRERNTSAAAPASPFERVVKRVAGIGVIVSLLLALFQVAKLVHDAADRMARINALGRVAHFQSNRGDAGMAWGSLEQALGMADAAGPLESSLWAVQRHRRALQAQQEDVAMQWLRDGRPGPGKPFSDIVDRASPVLEQAAVGATGQRLADILAHLGWARFLKGRDGTSTVDPARDYANAVAADAHNAYAHAFWGHWILWQQGDLAAASRQFADALTDHRAASGSVRAYVRRLQIAALRNANAAQADAALRALIGTMRADGEPIDPDTLEGLQSTH